MIFVILILFVLAFGTARLASSRYRASQTYASKIVVPGGLSAREAMTLFLKDNGASDVRIVEHSSYQTNYFDAKRRVLYFEPSLLESESAFAWAMGLHEAAHALQTDDMAPALRWRHNNIQIARYLPAILGLVCLLLVFLKRVPGRLAVMSFVLVMSLLMLAIMMSSPVEKQASKCAFAWLERRFLRNDSLLEVFRMALLGAAWRDSATPLKSPAYLIMALLPMASKPRPF